MARGRPLLPFRARPKAENRLKLLPPDGAEYVRDWTALAPGDKVYIVENDASELCGRVDAVTEDGAILWLYMDAAAGRRLFMRGDGGVVWRVRVDALP